MSTPDRIMARAAALTISLASASGCTDPPGSAATSAGGTAVASETQASTASTTSTSTAGPDLPANAPPPVPALLSPRDGATDLPLETELCWQPVDDPEGDAVRYRVFIDGAVLGEGIMGEDEGYEGPCVGPLLFAHERAYTWEVEAFEAADPSRSSGRSDVWTFHTIGDGLSELVFEDDFEDELGWTLDGVGSGAWVRGQPDEAFDGPALSQPGACPHSDTCYFTGHNPDGIATASDVAGGATSLLSPAFDLGGASTATIRLRRFFYKSALMDGAQLRVELLVPDLERGFEVHELERLDAGTEDAPANSWIAVEYAACDAPMRDGSRLRITALDVDPGLGPGADVLEAAIDDVSVHAHDDPSLCDPGLGGRCDPGDPLPTCGDALRCCSQGVINRGVYRCEDPVPGLLFDEPTATPDDPGNGPPGCNAPDLIVDPGILDPLFTDIFMTESTCELLEGCVGAAGWRSVMLFTVSTPNVGAADMALGVPANLPELYHYSPCHDHYHFDEFARYELRDGGDIVATGHKQAFCLLDTVSWAWPLAPTHFDCANQGVSRGFSDYYESGLPCQWVDITGVAAGDYTLRISLNEPRPDHAVPTLNERDYQNNVLELPVTIP